ncbi:MAG TPA: glycosyl hydrolase family 28 protein [Opitutaceae bacterium]|jgi:polygalacturonase|nr:glycosyl hydrolase family 28 protein [Opitutaceae bacterium]
MTPFPLLRALRPLPWFCLLGWLSGAPTLLARVDYDVTAFGAAGKDIAADTAAIQRAIDACAQTGGRVIVPPGAHFTIGTIVLKSHIDFWLGPGSLLEASPHYSDFTRFAYPPVNFDPAPPKPIGVVVYADGADDLTISGSGQIDGNCLAYVTARLPHIYQCPNDRPFAMVLKNCRQLRLRNFSLTNSAFWTLRLLGCSDAVLEDLRIDGDLRMPNNDGIDIDRCSNVRIHDCNISTGDDCISLKAVPLSEGIERACENVIITGCNLRSRSSGVVVGCDCSGPIHDVVVSDCIIRDSHRGVAVRLSLEGTMEHILFSNLIIETKIFDPKWWGRGEPIQIEAAPWNAQSKLGRISDVRFSHLDCRSENGAVVYGSEPGHIDGISFDHVFIRINRPSEFPGGQQDFRPMDGDAMPAMPTSGFLLRDAAGVTIRDCGIAWGPNPPSYFQHALDAKGCPGLVVSDLTGGAAHPGEAARAVQP